MFNYEGKLKGGLYNPNCLVVSKSKANKKFCGLGTPSFIKSRGILEDDIEILENKFTLHNITNFWKSGGSIEQGTYFSLDLLSCTSSHVISLTIPAEHLLTNKIFKGSELENGTKFTKSKVCSVIVHNSQYKIILHDSEEFLKYKREWDEYISNKDKKRRETTRKIKEEEEKYKIGEVYLTMTAPESADDILKITKYIYLGKDIHPKIYVKKRSFIDKGAKKHIFVALETIHYLSANENVREIVSKLKTDQCNKEDLMVNLESKEDKETPKVIRQPYYNKFLSNEILKEGEIASLIDKDCILSPFSLEETVVLSYTNKELLESRDETIYHSKSNPVLYSFKEPERFTSSNLRRFTACLENFVDSLFGREELYNLTLQRKSIFFKYKPSYYYYKKHKEENRRDLLDRKSTKFPYKYYTELYSLYLKRNLEIDFKEVIKHDNMFPLDINIANNVSFRIHSKSIRPFIFYNLEYFGEDPIEINKTRIRIWFFLYIVAIS